MNSSDPDARAAMRAYLQRAEVRLSTMHRVAGAFISGAGLLILFPVFFNNTVVELIQRLLGSLGTQPDLSHMISVGCLSFALAISFVVPLASLFLLLKDLVRFYFVGHSPGFPTAVLNPRFVLTGIGFSPDESEEAKQEIYRFQYGSDLIHFILPFGEDQAAYYDKVAEATTNGILPPERNLDTLRRKGILEPIPESHELNVTYPPGQRRSAKDITRFNAALGLAGTRDRRLVEEVAKSEVSLVAHALGLRRLLLRYMKALLMFILTALVSFLLVGILKSNVVDPLWVLAIGYTAWGVSAYFTVALPIRWIGYSSDPRAQNVVHRDPHLYSFQRFARRSAVASAVVSVLAILALTFL